MWKFRWPWRGATLIYCGFIFYLSSRPDLGEGPPWWLDWPGSDKFVHVVLFGGLAGVVALGLLRSNGAAISSRAMFVVPVIFAVGYGVTDEVHQLFVPPRSAEFLDLFADAAGATMVSGIVAVLRPLFGNQAARPGDA